MQIIEGNIIDTTAWEGLRVQQSSGIDVLNNTVTNAGGNGIDVRSSSNVFLFGNRSCGNEGVDVRDTGKNTTGDENTADSTAGWDDEGTTGATYSSSDPLRYDFNGDSVVDDKDVALLIEAIKSGTGDHKYDMDGLNDKGAHYGVTEYDKEYLLTRLMGAKAATGKNAPAAEVMPAPAPAE